MDETYYEGEGSFQDVSNMTQDNTNQHLTSNDINLLIPRIDKLHSDIASELSDEQVHDVDYEQIEAWAKEIDTLTERIDSLPVVSLDILKTKISFYLSEIEQANGDSVTILMYKSKIMNALSEEALLISKQDVQIRA
jgi:hypothetical protein